MSKIRRTVVEDVIFDIFVYKILKINTQNEAEGQIEDSRPLNQTQPTLVNSSCHKGIQRNAFLLKTGFYYNIYKIIII